MKLKKNGEPDLRVNNGGHTNTKPKLDPKDKKISVDVFLSENEFKSKGWKRNVCEQVENKMNKKIN